jgi:hypothetical protein
MREQVSVKGIQNLLGKARLTGIWLIYPLYSCFSYFADRTSTLDFLKYGMERDSLYDFKVR